MRTYLQWEVKAESAFVRVIASSEIEAIGRAKQLLPGRECYILSVVEQWIPGSASRGQARLGKARRGMARQGEAGQG